MYREMIQDVSFKDEVDRVYIIICLSNSYPVWLNNSRETIIGVSSAVYLLLLSDKM
jgi:hypothetical protein